jgi:hypothetical protein
VDDIFTILRRQHEEVESLVAQLEAAPGETGIDDAARDHLRRHLVIASSRHEAAEELVFWPAVRKQMEGGVLLADRALQQERDGRFYLDALRVAKAGTQGDLVAEYAKVARGHIAFEEGDVWPALRASLSWVGRKVLGSKFRLAHRLSPTRPHPRGPDHPVGLLTGGLFAATLDRLRDRLSGRTT